jgi:histidine triad (HIT) family protein
VHILIIPNSPFPTVNDITDADAPLVGRLFLVARDLAKRWHCRRRLPPDRELHCMAGREVYHLHR